MLPNCLIFLLSYLCQLMAGCANPTHLLLWLAITSLENLLFYAIGTVAAHVTGSLPAMPVLYGLVNFAVSACELLMNDFACALYYGVNSLELRLSGLSPFLFLLGECEHCAELVEWQFEVVEFHSSLHQFEVCHSAMCGFS